MSQQGKSLLSSKTFWFNVVAIIVEIAVYLETTVPAKYLPYISAVHAIGNIVLRYISTKKITSLI